MSRPIALLIAAATAIPLSILVERITSAPSQVGSGLAGLFGVAFYDLLVVGLFSRKIDLNVRFRPLSDMRRPLAESLK